MNNLKNCLLFQRAERLRLERDSYEIVSKIRPALGGGEFAQERIRIMDKHTCQICGKVWKKGTRRFDVHHLDCDKEKSKQHDIFKKEKDNMVTLCHKCHIGYHLNKN